MLLFEKFNEIVLKYKKIYAIANINNSRYYLVIILTFLTVGLDALGIGMLIPIGEYILNYEKDTIPNTTSWKIVTEIFAYLDLKPNIIFIVSSMLLIIIFRQIITFIRTMVIDIMRFKSVKQFREKLFYYFLQQDIFYIKKHSTGVYNNIINLEVENIGKAIILPLENISGLILIISYFFLMMLISVNATVVVFATILIIGIFLKKFLSYIENVASKIIHINNKFSQNIVDRLVAVKLIRINNMIDKEQTLNEEILADQFSNNVRLSRVQKIIDSSIEPLLLIVAVPIIGIAISLNFPLAKLGVFVILLARFIPVFKVTITGIQSHATYFASIKNMLNLIKKISEQKEIRLGEDIAPLIIKKIEFKNISFKYEDSEKNVLENFSCTIKGGVINAIMGVSGKGKSTLVNFIPRLLEPNKGVIKINEKNIAHMSIKSLRNICSYIEQKPSFMRGTIIEHIAYNNKKINLKKSIEAAKLAQAHDFIMSLPNNYYHKLGEGGVGLSGGQLQRLDISRGIASDKPLMILDEPTSNLDKKNTKDILLTLKNINKHKKNTILIITHDTNIIKYCENVIKI